MLEIFMSSYCTLHEKDFSTHKNCKNKYNSGILRKRTINKSQITKNKITLSADRNYWLKSLDTVSLNKSFKN